MFVSRLVRPSLRGLLVASVGFAVLIAASPASVTEAYFTRTVNCFTGQSAYGIVSWGPGSVMVQTYGYLLGNPVITAPIGNYCSELACSATPVAYGNSVTMWVEKIGWEESYGYWSAAWCG